MRNQILMAGTVFLLALPLQGCAVWEYVFGGPNPEDLPEIIMHMPVTPALTTPVPPFVNQPPQYPTEWHRGQLLDR